MTPSSLTKIEQVNNLYLRKDIKGMMRASLYQCFEESSFPTIPTTWDDAALHCTQKAASSSLLFSTKQTMGTASASAVVRSAASLFQHHSDIDVEQILQVLQREQLTEGWQLGYLDSFQWKVLGVPLGLVMCIRKCLFEDEPRTEREGWEEMQSSVSNEPTKVNRACPSPLSVTQPPLDWLSKTPTSCHGSFLAEKAGSSMDCQPPKIPQRKQSILQPGESQSGGFRQRMFLLSLENDEDAVDRMGFLLSPRNTLHSRPPVQPKRLSSVSLASSSMRSLFELEGENCNRWR